jgi:PAS domain S-box-containing protein
MGHTAHFMSDPAKPSPRLCARANHLRHERYERLTCRAFAFDCLVRDIFADSVSSSPLSYDPMAPADHQQMKVIPTPSASIPDGDDVWHLQAITRFTPHVISRFDRQYRHVFVTDFAASSAGMTRDQMVGKTNRELGMPDEVVSVWEHHYETAFQTGQVQVLQFHYDSPSGRRHYEARIIPEIPPEGGDIEYLLGVALDITAQEEAREELATAMRRLDAARQAGEVGMYEWDIPSDLLWCDDNFAQLFGKPDLATRPHKLAEYLDAMHPDDVEHVRHRIQQSLDTAEDYAIEYRTVSDGKVRWINVRGKIEKDAEGNARRFPGIGVDITERKKAQSALEAANARLSLLADASRLLGSSLDFEKTLRHVARGVVPNFADWCTIHLIKEDGTIERVATEHEDLEKVAWAKEVGERYPPDPDDPYSPLNIAKGGRVVMMGEIPDELLVAAAKDGAHLELLRSVGMRSFIAAPLIGSDGPLGSMTLIWGESGKNYTPDDIPFVEELGRRASQAIDNARAHRLLEQAEQRLSRMNRDLEVRVADRTSELEQSSRDLARANEQLKLRNRELEDFAHVASHDLQEPLRKIRAFSGLLLESAGDRLNAEETFYLERMESAAGRMSALIKDLLELSRIEIQQVRFESCDLDRVMSDVLDHLAVVIEDTGASVEVNSLGSIQADRTQMHQLFQNLVGNALKFRREDVVPRIRVTGERSTLETGADVLVVQVRDNGIGFDDSYAERAFAPFQRLHSKDRFSGTGMGLAIVRRILERHQGNAAVQSTPGKGTTFQIMLPLTQD